MKPTLLIPRIIRVHLNLPYQARTNKDESGNIPRKQQKGKGPIRLQF